MYLSRNRKIFLSVLIGLIFSFLLEAYIVLVEKSLNVDNFINVFSKKEMLGFFIIFFITDYIFLDDNLRFRTLNFIYNYRYPLSGLLIAVLVVLGIHGSSINELNLFGVDHNTLFGISRNIRSDEYNVNTLMAFSQYYNNFGYFSSILRAVPTDMFIVYGQPVFDAAIILRPFLIGYLFLNQTMGLSFFWVTRLIVLFLVSFEMGMLLTNRNKTLSLAYTLLITLSPLVQWWFAVNGLVEQLIFGQLGVLLVNFYMLTDDYRKRLVMALGLAVSIGAFLIVFYPSWQIPFAYIFLLLAFWIYLKNRSEFTYSKKDFLIIASAAVILALIMIHIFSNSFDTIKIILNTVYPGSERFNGGGEWIYLFNYVPSIFFPLTQMNIPINVVEASSFVDFFPLPLIIAFIVLYIQKTKDKLLYGLIALYVLFIIFYFVPVPDLIANITLRNHIKTLRMAPVIGFLGLLILIRSLSSLKEINRKLMPVISVILSLIIVYASTFNFTTYYASWMIIVLIVLYSLTFISMFSINSKKGKILFLACIIFTSFMTGALANPVDQGTGVVFESDYIQEVKSIAENNPDANWLVKDIGLNHLTAVGAKTINSVNTYPDLEKWQKLDLSNQNSEVYNRYAHIVVDFKNDSATSFELVSPDVFNVNLNVNDLEKLNVTYIATPYEMESFDNDNVLFEKIYESGSYKIYNVKYR